MAGKDPAMLLYTSDFLTGVSLLSMRERGQYITLICLQQQLGHMERRDMERVVGRLSDRLLEKFRQDGAGRLYNPRAEAEISKRAAHCQRQSEKINKRWNSAGTTGVLPYEDEDEKENGDEKEMINEKEGPDRAGDMDKSSQALECYRRRISPDPSASCARAIGDYAGLLGQDVVCHAIDSAADDNKRSWSYIKAILQRYSAQGIRSIQDVRRDEARRRPAAPAEPRPASMEDLERLEALL